MLPHIYLEAAPPRNHLKSKASSAGENAGGLHEAFGENQFVGQGGFSGLITPAMPCTTCQFVPDQQCRLNTGHNFQ